MIVAILRLLGLTLCIVSVAVVALENDRSLPPLLVEPPHPAAVSEASPRVVRVFFGGGDSSHKIDGVLRGVTLEQLQPLGVAPESFVVDGADIRFSFSAPGNDLVGFALAVPTGPVHWTLQLDGGAFPGEALFAGPFGLPAPELSGGVGASCLHGFAIGSGTPYFSHTTVGAFVICSSAAQS